MANIAAMNDEQPVMPIERIAQHILVLRGHKVLLDKDLAMLYGVTTKRLNEQVKRNSLKFPSDFRFQLTITEATDLKSQFATSSWGGHRELPFAFTEHGAIMAAMVLNSERAVNVGIYVVRAFVKLRELLSTHKQLAEKVKEHDRRFGEHDQQIHLLAEAIHQLMDPSIAPKKYWIHFGARRSIGNL